MRRAPTSTEEFERRPKTARKSEIDTKTKLLNAAERLFSDKGIEAVSHRDIALAAAVNLAALNYHFRSRQAFIQAVIPVSGVNSLGFAQKCLKNEESVQSCVQQSVDSR